MTALTAPNFFIVGAPKAGTDDLYYLLREHPQVYMSPLKEPNYFSTEVRPDNCGADLRNKMLQAMESTRSYLASDMVEPRFGGLVTEWNDYLRLFSGATGESAVGEGSVCYLWSKSAAAEIASRIPHARIIIVLMDPAERAFQQYLKSISDGTVSHSFKQHLNLAFDDPGVALGIYHPFLAFGQYASQLRRYLAVFPPEQLSISLYEDLESQRDFALPRFCAFLGINDRFSPPEVNVPSHPRVPRFRSIHRAVNLGGAKKLADAILPSTLKKAFKGILYQNGRAPKLGRDERRRLIEYYRAEILDLQDLIGRNLSSWLT